MLCYRAVDTTADEEGGGRNEKYEINLMGNLGHRILRNGRDNVATYEDNTDEQSRQ